MLVSSKIVEPYILQLLSLINKNSWHLLSGQQLTTSITASLSSQILEKLFSGRRMWNNVGYETGPTKLKVEICNMCNKIISIIRLMALHSLAILQRQLSVTLFVVYVMLIIISRWAVLTRLGRIRKLKLESRAMTLLFYVLLNMLIK